MTDIGTLKKFESNDDASIAAIRLVLDACDKRKGAHGHVRCPRCGEKLYWASDPGNGHVRAKCETFECTEFMQ